eukprot:12127876-Heterocapsa_arctica.AAC.1
MFGLLTSVFAQSWLGGAPLGGQSPGAVVDETSPALTRGERDDGVPKTGFRLPARLASVDDELGMSNETCDFIDAVAVDKEQRDYTQFLKRTTGKTPCSAGDASENLLGEILNQIRKWLVPHIYYYYICAAMFFRLFLGPRKRLDDDGADDW